MTNASQVVVFTCNTTSMYFKRQWCLLLLTSFVFIMSPVFSEFTLHPVCLCFKFRHLTKQIPNLHSIINLINVLSIGYFIHLLLLLLQHGDIESNLGPKNKQVNSPSCCHWNVNSLLLQILSKISQTEAYHSFSKHDFICIWETYFDSTILEDESFHLNSYNLLRVDQPNNTNRGGVCIYYKESLGVHEVKLSNLSQCIICEISLQNCKGYNAVIYRSPSQDSTKFEVNCFNQLLVYHTSRWLQCQIFILVERHSW